MVNKEKMAYTLHDIQETLMVMLNDGLNFESADKVGIFKTKVLLIIEYL